jgi:predicted GNAT family N-acyltransferase
MTVHDFRIASELPPTAGDKIRALDGPHLLRLASRLVVFTPDGQRIAALMDTARKAIPMLTSATVVERLASHNPDCFWAVSRKDRFDIKAPNPEGYFAFLPLNKAGLAALLDGSLDRKNPPLAAIAAQNEKAAGIYIWHVYAPGPLAAGLSLACSKIAGMHSPEADFYAWGTTDAAIRFMDSMGFRKLPRIAGSAAPQFHVYRRAPQVAPTPTHVAQAPQALSVKVARSFEDLAKAVAIRGAVYIGEQECPYAEEFDGNDFSATHLIGYVGDEPAGCMRVRYFADFAKVERLVVRKEFRSSGLARELVSASVGHCRAKGYVRVYVYAQKRLVKFWTKCGFTVSANARELEFSDFDYIEMINIAPRRSDAICEATDPYIIIRPEGDWNSPGVLESSRVRGVRRPSANEAAA